MVGWATPSRTWEETCKSSIHIGIVSLGFLCLGPETRQKSLGTTMMAHPRRGREVLEAEQMALGSGERLPVACLVKRSQDLTDAKRKTVAC